jgi:uncharacterized membrane protein YphA (DoxX/SURF4 family)
VLGLVLLVAAALKALDPAAFAAEIVRQGVSFGLPPMAAALVALAIESIVGALLLVNLRRPLVLAAATALVLFFLFLTGRTAWRAAHGQVDDAASCGCFGNLVERTPNEAFVQDLLWLAPALAVAWIARPGARDQVGIRAGAAFGLTAAIVGLGAAAPGLPLDDWATRLRPGVAIADLCAGAGEARVCLPLVAPAVASGRHLVVIADVRDPGFPALAARLNRYVREGGDPPLTVLADLKPEEQQALYWQVAPAFDLQATPAALLRPLYRQLPRGFLLDGGRVERTWAGLPPAIPAAPAK